MYFKRIIVLVICLLCIQIRPEDFRRDNTSLSEMTEHLLQKFSEHTDKFNLTVAYDFQIDEIYENILDTIKWQKIEDLLNPRQFWELVGYEEYHDKAVAYDYVDYINKHNDGLYQNETFRRFDYFYKRKVALQQSIEIMDKEIYQNPLTDVKFVSLSPGNLEELKGDESTNDNFESYICVSGFLSQRDNLKDSWHAILDRSGDTPVFGFKWPAEDAASIFQRILLEIANIRFDNIGNLSFGDILAFNGVRELANEAGKLLAYSIVMEFPKYLPKISFVAFSLGTEVVKSCLEELHRLGVKDRVKDVYLMGGATTITANETHIFDVVSGDLTHIYTPSDRILDFYEFSTGEIPIGQSELDYEVVKNLNEMGVSVRQVDISHVSNGHLQYRTYLDQILETIDF